MMGGAAFILLKAGQTRPESAKQAEIRLAILLKILRIARFAGKNPRQSRTARAVVAFATISAGYG
jgi:hypothetical protein